MIDWVRSRWLARRWTIWVPLAILLLALLLTPPGLLDKAHLVGYGVCHQIPERSFQPGGVPLPLCARCSGTFLGGLLGLALVGLLGRWRAAVMPPPRVLVLLVVFVLFMGVDGANSYISFFPGLPHLYAPNDALRVVSGALCGLAMALLLQPVVAMVAWREPQPRQAVPDLRTLAGFVAAELALAYLLHAEWAWSLYPLALLSAAGVLAMLTAINTALVIIVARRENSVASWRQMWPYVLWGGAASVAQLAAVGLARTLLSRWLGVPI